MKYKIIILSTLLFVCSPFAGLAQTSNSEVLTSWNRQNIMLKVVELFEDYEKYCSIDEDFSKYVTSFNSLFVNSNAPVYNDLLGIAYETSIPARDYSKLLSENSMTTRASISNLICQSPYFENGVWKIKCLFDKKMDITNKCGIEFASDFFNTSDYHLSAIIVYDSQNKSCRFEKIDGTTQAKRQLVKGYRVVNKLSDRDNNVLHDGKPLEFNEMGQAFISPTGKFVYPPDMDVVVKEVVEDKQCNFIHLKYSNKPWRIKAHYDLILGNALSVGNELLYSSVKPKSSSFGLDAGYVFPSKSKFKIGVFLGFGIASTSLDLSYSNDLYSFFTNQDVDGDSYTRYYKNLKFSQTTKLTELTIPVYADFEWRFSKWVSLYLDAGIQLNLNMSNSVNDFTGNASDVYGIYSKYDNLYLDYNWGYNGFTRNLALSKENLCEDERVQIKKFAPNILAGVGFRINIPRTPLAFDLGMGYQRGIGDIISVSENVNANQYNGQLIYNQISNGNSTEHVHNLIESTDGVSRGFMRFNLGLIFKF